MDEKEEIYSLIDQYLTNRLSESERRKFEQRCLDDPAFAEEVKLHTQAEYASRSYAREQKKHELKALFAKETTESTPIRNMRMLRYVAAAAIVLLAIAGLYRYFSPPPTLPELYAAYSEPFETFSIRRSSTENFSTTDRWEEAAILFNQKNYWGAIKAIEDVLEDSTFDSRPKAYLYLGLCSLYDSDNVDPSEDDSVEWLVDAVHYFEQVPPESSFIEKAQWYTALAWLKAGNRPKAIEALEVVNNYPNHYRQSKAEAVLNQLASSR